MASTAARAGNGVAPAQRLTDGFGLAFTVGAGITLAGAVLALALLRQGEPTVAPLAETAEARDESPDALAA